MLSDDDINDVLERVYGFRLERWELEEGGGLVMELSRAIESAATEPLLAEIERLTRQLEEARKQMERQKDEWLSWESKRKALEQDAERYQAIRSGLEMDAIVRVTKDPGMWETPYPVLLRGEELDAAIDAAIKEQTK